MHPLLRAQAERQLGVFTAVDAVRAGYGDAEIQRRCAAGTWTRLRRGVYVTTELLTRAEERGSRHRLTDPTLWRRGQGFRMTRAPLLPDEVRTAGPLRFTAAARTLVDCAREWDEEDAVVAMDAALLAEHVTPRQLRDAVTAARLWPGAPVAARAVDLADGRAESPLESRGRLRIVGAGLPTPELQVGIRAGSRLVAVVDAWFDDAAVAVEFDGRVKYTDPWRGRTPERVLWEEKRREDDLRALDIRIVRVADADLGTGWPRIEARLRALLGTAGPAVRSFSAVPRSRRRRRSA